MHSKDTITRSSLAVLFAAALLSGIAVSFLFASNGKFAILSNEDLKSQAESIDIYNQALPEMEVRLDELPIESVAYYEKCLREAPGDIGQAKLYSRCLESKTLQFRSFLSLQQVKDSFETLKKSKTQFYSPGNNPYVKLPNEYNDLAIIIEAREPKGRSIPDVSLADFLEGREPLPPDSLMTEWLPETAVKELSALLPGIKGNFIEIDRAWRVLAEKVLQHGSTLSETERKNAESVLTAKAVELSAHLKDSTSAYIRDRKLGQIRIASNIMERKKIHRLRMVSWAALCASLGLIAFASWRRVKLRQTEGM